MNKKIKLFVHRTFKIIKWAFFILLGLFIILIIYRLFYKANLEKTMIQVNKIHSTKLTMADVMGKDLPPNPGTLANTTVRGIDVNKNGIRDDVELAIFKKYPNSAKTRAVLLQYALVLQMEFTQPIINTKTVTEIAKKESQSYDCIGQIVPRSDDDLEKIESYRNFVEKKQINTVKRKKIKKNFDSKLGSFELQSGCDVNLSIFSKK